MATNQSILVVGAGVAGISCAHHLVKNGFTNLTILEASDTWGGRVRTEPFGQSIVELGANWIHGGCLTNPVFQLANRNPDNLLHDGVVLRYCRRNGFYYLPDKGKCIEKELGEKVFDEFFKIHDEMDRIFKTGEAPENMNMLDFVKIEFPKIISKFEKNEQPIAESILWGMVNYLRFHSGDDLEFCSLNLYGSYEELPGGDVKIPGGYRNVFTCLFQKIKDQIQFEKFVKKINYEGKEVLVHCQDGTEYSANRVVVTIPLGHLKKNVHSLFCPRLPIQKLEAIEKMGFGRSGKIFLEFEFPFWAKGEEVAKLAWGKDAILDSEYPECWYRSILGFDEVLNNRNVLVAWIGGQGAEIMETLSDDIVIGTVTRILRDCTGNPGLDPPIRIWKTNWITNPLFCGTYSFASVTSKVPEMTQTLAQPILMDRGRGHSSLHFAGEATHDVAYSTVHGAMLSGIREAERIIKMCKEEEANIN